MRVVILAALILVLIPSLAYIAIRVAGPSNAVPVPSDRNPEAFRNHQHMARMLDNMIHDDFVSGVIPDQQKQHIRQLLVQYYDNPQIGNE